MDLLYLMLLDNLRDETVILFDIELAPLSIQVITDTSEVVLNLKEETTVAPSEILCSSIPYSDKGTRCMPYSYELN